MGKESCIFNYIYLNWMNIVEFLLNLLRILRDMKSVIHVDCASQSWRTSFSYVHQFQQVVSFKKRPTNLRTNCLNQLKLHNFNLFGHLKKKNKGLFFAICLMFISTNRCGRSNGLSIFYSVVTQNSKCQITSTQTF